MAGKEEHAGSAAGPAPKEPAKAPSAHPNVVDMMLSKSGARVVDSETLIKNIQMRVWSALQKGYKYTGIVNEAEQFLRPRVLQRLDMMVLYVDLVGSTTMSLEMSEDKLATIISAFAQEMAYVVTEHGGYVLKFIGDAVLGFFPSQANTLMSADNAVGCAQSMITAITKGINPILNQYDYPDLRVKAGIDYGQAIVVRYGSDEDHSPVDMIGPPMNIAAKIQSLAKPNQILIGDDVYTRLHPSTQKQFHEIVWKHNEWKYRSRVTGEIYKVHGHARAPAEKGSAPRQ